jgi:hypothetical protein
MLCCAVLCCGMELELEWKWNGMDRVEFLKFENGNKWKGKGNILIQNITQLLPY